MSELPFRRPSCELTVLRLRRDVTLKFVYRKQKRTEFAKRCQKYWDKKRRKPIRKDCLQSSQQTLATVHLQRKIDDTETVNRQIGSGRKRNVI